MSKQFFESFSVAQIFVSRSAKDLMTAPDDDITWADPAIRTDFDQNPFDGSYILVLRAKTRDYPTSRILTLAAELVEIADQFRHAEVLYDFEVLTDESIK